MTTKDIETETTTIRIWFSDNGQARYARVPALDDLPLEVVERLYPAPNGAMWEKVTPFEAYLVWQMHIA